MGSYDLTFEVGQFLDHHLMLKVLDFLDEAKVTTDPRRDDKLSHPLSSRVLRNL